MADLSWYPHTPAKWRTRTAGLSPLAKAAYLELRDHAWEATSRKLPPCTLPNDDAKLRNLSGLYEEWASVSAEVRTLFRVTDHGLLDWCLLAIWEKRTQIGSARDRAAAGGFAAKNARPGVAFADIAKRAPRVTVNGSRRAALMLRDGNACVWCGTRERLQLDHVIPLTHGGTNDDDNYQVLCEGCNLHKLTADSREASNG